MSQVLHLPTSWARQKETFNQYRELNLQPDERRTTDLLGQDTSERMIALG